MGFQSERPKTVCESYEVPGDCYCPVPLIRGVELILGSRFDTKAGEIPRWWTPLNTSVLYRTPRDCTAPPIDALSSGPRPSQLSV
jgi:hypothetical protein